MSDAISVKQTGVAKKEPQKKRMSGLRRKEAMWGIAFASPYLIGFLLWIAIPVLASFIFSFFQYDIVSFKWLGIQNYVRAFTSDRLFYRAYSRTFYYAVLSVPIGITTSLGLAILLNQKIRGAAIFRSLFYAPSLTPVTALALLWVWIFNTQFGVLNYLIKSIFSVAGPNWGAPEWAMPVVIIAGTWAGAGGSSMLIFLAALQGVPTELYEAAEMDGAGGWRKFTNVTLPIISPTIFFLTVLGVIGSVKNFDIIFNMSPDSVGGPAYSRYVMSLHIYNSAFRYSEMGYASALSWIFLVLILLLTLVQFIFQKRWVFYAGEVVS
jgi:multiple sugar transport system permease protein